MGDVCTNSPTQTIFATSTSQGGGSVSQSTSQSVSVGQGSVVTRSVQSGTEWIITESSVGGSTETVQVEVPVTISGEQQVFTVPISTLFAPCTSSTPTTSSTSTSTTPTSTTPTSTSTTPTSTPETSETPVSRTSSTQRTTPTTSPTSSQNTGNANPTPSPPSTPTVQPEASVSQTGTLTTFTASAATTLPNGSQSIVVVLTTSSIAPSGGLNGDNSGSGGKSSSNSGRAVAIGVGVAGGFLALIIIMFGITWHIRRKRRNQMPLDDSEIWGPHHEAKTPPLGSGLAVNNPGPGYTYNPYSQVQTTAYAPVPTMSPPRPRPMTLAESEEHRLSAGSYATHPSTTNLTAPLLARAKTADQILYEAAREGLPKSRASSATASHHTQPSETGVSHRPNASFAASHKTHGSLASRTSGSAVGLIEHPAAASTHGSLHNDAQAAQRYQDLMDAPAELERPMSPVSIAAPRLAIVNPDVDKDP